MIERPFLLDVTRLISRSWTRRRSTGLDRVCYAYLGHFRSRAQAVVQHKGIFRILTESHTDLLCDILSGPDAAFRRKLSAFAPQALAAGATRIDAGGAAYINVSHTDFDLNSHVRWAAGCGFRPIYMIHDLIPITHSEFCSLRAVRRHRGRVINALRTAAGVIANSAATARDLQAFAGREGLPIPPILAAPLAGAGLVEPAAERASVAPYFLCVGTIEPRKNHAMLLRLWHDLAERLGDETPRLVIIGQWGFNSEPVRKMLAASSNLRAHVTVHAQCTDEQLGGWISGAQALLMPTIAEGFGLPMAEALKLGTPVIASDLPSLREVGQGIPTLLDPHDTAAWERTIVAFHRDGAERSRQLALIRTYRPMSWDRHFSSVDAWLQLLPERSCAKEELAFDVAA